jgi:hypothetical protein
MITITVRCRGSQAISLGTEFRRLADLLQHEAAHTPAGVAAGYELTIDDEGHIMLNDATGRRIIENPRSHKPHMWVWVEGQSAQVVT